MTRPSSWRTVRPLDQLEVLRAPNAFLLIDRVGTVIAVHEQESILNADALREFYTRIDQRNRDLLEVK
jgi:hypothetical protein